MYILSIASICIGYLFNDLVIGIGTTFWNQSIYTDPINFSIDQEFLISPFVKNLPVICSLSAAFFSWYFCSKSLSIKYEVMSKYIKLSSLKTISFIGYYISLCFPQEMYFSIFRLIMLNSRVHIIKERISIIDKSMPSIPVFIYYKLFSQRYIKRLWYSIKSFGYHAGYFNIFYDVLFKNIYIASYEHFTKYLDKGLFEYSGPWGFYKLFKYLNKKSILLFPTIGTAIFYMFIGLISIINLIFFTAFYVKWLDIIFLLLIIIIFEFFFSDRKKLNIGENTIC
jgi:hypothetical protein